jgi:hypothetical protein
MNKKLVRKLALSAVTLGVAALSVTTTTFAWFTTNGSATASEVNATVVSSDANLMIRSYDSTKQTPAWDGWTTSATLHTPTGTNLKPVSITGGTGTTYDETKFYTLSNSNQQFAEAQATDVLVYKIQYAITDIPQSKQTDLKIYFSDFKFSTDDSQGGTANANKKNQYLLVDATKTPTTDTKAVAGQTVKLGLEEVLNMRVRTVYSDQAGEDLTTGTGATFFNSTLRYQTDAAKDGSDALVYYNNIYGTTLNRPDSNYNDKYASKLMSTTSDSSTALTIATFNGSVSKIYATSYIYFFIDGWDYQCFSAIGGSAITAGKINFEIKTRS